jgi:hypothetical protein
MRRRTGFIALSLALASMAIAELPSAAAGWSPPLVLSAPSTMNSSPHVVTTVRGEIVTVWIEEDVGDPFPMRMMARTRRADGTLEDPVELSPELRGCVLDLATDAFGNVIASWQLPDGAIKVARRPPDGKFGAPETVNGWNDGGGSAELTMNARGDAALMWSEFRPHEYAGQWTHFAAVSRAGAPFSEPVLLEPWREVATGGYDVALTPSGDAVAVWTANPEQDPARPTYGDPARVETATLTRDGAVTPVQKLAEFEGAATCPQVLSDAHGRVAALWHEIHRNYCALWGRDMLALRMAGSRFDQPVEVPTSTGNVSRGSLAVSEDGQITVGFSDQDGGELLQGSFDTPLEVVVPAFPAQGDAPSLSGSETGELVFGPAEGQQLETARLRGNGDLAAVQDLRRDCAYVSYATFDVNRHGLAAAAMASGGRVDLAVDSFSDPPGSRKCNPQSTGLWGSGGGSGAPARGGPPVAPAAGGFALHIDKARLYRHDRKVRLTVRVHCGAACSVRGQGKLIGRDGSHLARASGRRSYSHGSGWLRLKFKAPRGLPASRRLKRASLRIIATDRSGNVLTGKLSVRRTP